MTDNKLMMGILAVITILAGAGGNMILTKDQISNAYVCTTNLKIGIFERFSSTMKTAYWHEGSVEKSSTCTNGLWQPLKSYADQHGIILEAAADQPTNSNSYICPRQSDGPCEVQP